MILAKKVSASPKLKTGNFTVTNQSFVVNPWTLSISLDRSDYKQGYLLFYQPVSLLFYQPVSLVSSKLRRRNIFISFGTALDDAASRSTSVHAEGIYGYTILHQWIKGYSYRVDSILSDYVFSTVGDYIRVNKCYIEGSNIKVEFQCRSSSRLLTIEGQYYVYH